MVAEAHATAPPPLPSPPPYLCFDLHSAGVCTHFGGLFSECIPQTPTALVGGPMPALHKQDTKCRCIGAGEWRWWGWSSVLNMPLQFVPCDCCAFTAAVLHPLPALHCARGQGTAGDYVDWEKNVIMPLTQIWSCGIGVVLCISEGGSAKRAQCTSHALL